MLIRFALSIFLTLGMAACCFSQETESKDPPELELIKAWVGVWDAEFEVWPQGPDAKSMKFKGVETNRAFGKHWIASDLDSTVMGQTMTVHSIIGYDLDQKKIVGTIIDYGPYKASLTAEYNPKKKELVMITKAKDLQGKPMVQRTVVTQKSETERVMVLTVPSPDDKDKFSKMMEIKFTKRTKK